MRARVGSLDVNYEISGPEGAPVVTFVHGLAASLGIWAGQAERLSGRFRVLRYDLRAHGGTASPDLPCSRHDLAADLAGLLDALGIARTAVVGHSAGGVVTQQFAVDAQLAKLIHDDRDAATLGVGQQVAQQRGLAAAQKAGNDGGGDFSGLHQEVLEEKS